MKIIEDREIMVTIQGCPDINLNSRVNHFKQHKEMQNWKQISYYSFAPFKPIKPFTKVKIYINRFYSGKNKPRDYDNLVACMKPIIDGAVDVGIMVDDNYEVTGSWVVKQTKDENKGNYLRVLIEGSYVDEK